MKSRTSKISQWTCEECNSLFLTRTARKSRFCSPKCRQAEFERRTGYYHAYRRTEKAKDRYRKNITYDKNCKYCSSQFSTINNNYKYCSKNCRLSFLKESRKSTGVPKIPKEKNIYSCSVCQSVIRYGKYCIDHKPTYKKVQHDKICETCKEPFVAKRITAQYCKRSCLPSRKARKKAEKRKKTKAKPEWMSWGDIARFEATRPTGMDLDHIIPLNHPKVSGLHIPENFQWLSPEENNKKSNKFDGTRMNESWRKLPK